VGAGGSVGLGMMPPAPLLCGQPSGPSVRVLPSSQWHSVLLSRGAWNVVQKGIASVVELLPDVLEIAPPSGRPVLPDEGAAVADGTETDGGAVGSSRSPPSMVSNEGPDQAFPASFIHSSIGMQDAAVVVVMVVWPGSMQPVVVVHWVTTFVSAVLSPGFETTVAVPAQKGTGPVVHGLDEVGSGDVVGSGDLVGSDLGSSGGGGGGVVGSTFGVSLGSSFGGGSSLGGGSSFGGE
jgi:hypothetical protein